jgi:hypothetical protein
MQILRTNQTYLNTSNKDIQYKVVYINSIGHKQEKPDTLKPLQSITKTNPQNKVIIYN